jgi:uncharacterized lipoprotein NlpE involved in copper resistance
MKKLVLATIGAFAAAILVGCENPGWNQWDSVSLQNNSDQTIILRRQWLGTTPDPLAAVAPGKTAKTEALVAAGQCQTDWDIVDTSGKQLRTIDKVCAGETVVYP